MASRMDRYQSRSGEKAQTRASRHKELYENFYAKTVYKEISSIDDIPQEDRAIDLGVMKLNTTTRENYHKVKHLEDFIDSPKEKKTEDLSGFSHEEAPKVYDINSVLKEAKKNRENKDELESRRKLQNNDLNILNRMTQEELELLSKKGKGKDTELKSLIRTITTNSSQEDDSALLEEEEDTDLLDDLMPSSLNETVISEELSKEILDKELEEKQKEEENTIDHSFYTRSMDLTDADFDDDELDNEFVENQNSIVTFFKVLFVVVLIVLAAVFIFYVMNQK